MSRGRRTIGGLLVVLSLAIAAFAWLGREPPATDAGARGVVDVPAGGDEPRPVPLTPESGNPLPARPAPLPPPEAPLARALPALRAAADAGDRRAACRLGLELLRCQHLGAWSALLETASGDEAEAAYVAEGNLVAANHVAEERLWRMERLQQCGAVPAELRSQGTRYLRQSALAGDPHAMFAYAEGHQWPPSMRGMAIDPAFDQWRREAPAMMHAALRAGNPSAAYILQINYSDDFGFLSAMIPNDPYRSYAYHLLLVRLFGHRERPGLARELDAAAIESARREAARMHEQYFGGRQFPSELSLIYPPYVRRSNSQSNTSCEIAQ